MNFTIDDESKNVELNDTEIIINGIKNKEIVINGMNDVPNYRHADTLRMLIIDDDGNEIETSVIVSIIKYTNNKISYIPARIFYADINMYRCYYNKKKELINRPKTPDEWYRFTKSFIIQENERLVIKPNFINSNKISKEKSRFALDATLKDVEEAIKSETKSNNN